MRHDDADGDEQGTLREVDDALKTMPIQEKSASEKVVPEPYPGAEDGHADHG